MYNDKMSKSGELGLEFGDRAGATKDSKLRKRLHHAAEYLEKREGREYSKELSSKGVTLNQHGNEKSSHDPYYSNSKKNK